MQSAWYSSTRWGPTPPWPPLRLRPHRRAGLLRDTQEPRQKHHAAYEPSRRRDGTFDGRRGSDYGPALRNLRRAIVDPYPGARSGGGDGQPRSAPAEEGKGAHRGERMRALILACLLSGPQPDRRSPFED